MSLVIFTGPTIAATEARGLCEAVYLPPVQQGDLYRVAAFQRPRAIGIIDGYFQQVPAVWHKEILWAMAQGIHVFGAASMGALRAAELHEFGMQGIGKIFAAYREGVLEPYRDDAFEDDDEVAVIHGPSETGYLALSEAMINIRCTLARAETAGIIGTTTRDALVGIGKGLFYPDRAYARLLECALEQGLPRYEINALRDWLPTGQVNQKREDALAMLTTLQTWLAADPQPKRVNYCFEPTALWEKVTASLTVENTGVQDETASLVLTELRLQGPSYDDVRRTAMLRMLALQECRRRHLTVTRDELRHVAGQFRHQVGMLRRADANRWLAENHLDWHSFNRLMEEEALLRKLEVVIAPELEYLMVDQLRITGGYPRFLARAQQKEAAISVQDKMPFQCNNLPPFKLVMWYFTCQLGQAVPDDLDAYAANLGFASTAAFYQALAAEYLLVTSEKQAPDDE